MPDPVVGAAIAKTLKLAGGERSGEKLIQRVLGPSADVLGEALARWTDYRVRNVGRIIEGADKKSAGQPDGGVHPRVAHQLLEDGSYCDDDVMVDYLSGVLAAGRTPSGRDDRAVVWSRAVTGLSALQLRLHYLTYRELADIVHGRENVDLAFDAGRREARISLELGSLLPVLLNGLMGGGGDVLTHAVTGLKSSGLVGDTWTIGKSPVQEFTAAVTLEPSLPGIELYGWAMGKAGVGAHDFDALGVHETEPPLPRVRAKCPGISDPTPVHKSEE